MRSGLGRLVNFHNENGLELIGILFESNTTTSSDNDTIVIHVHGNYGNFYNNKFIWVMSTQYINNGIDFLSFNLSAHDGLCEGYDNGILRYIGGAVSDYNESILDIDAVIKYVEYLGYRRVILQGHSLGCDKIIDFLMLHPEKNNELILLSPVDSFAVQEKWLNAHKNESVGEQIKRLKNIETTTNKLEWLPIDEYGAEGANTDWIYKIPITRKCLISILEGSAFRYLNLISGEKFNIKNRAFAFLGANDGLQMSTQSAFKAFLNKHFDDIYVVDDLVSDHDIKGVERELTARIIDWIGNIIV